MNSDSTHGLRFVDYFSQFISKADYNESLHGEVKNKNKDGLFLVDTNGSNNKIDLIHMFASIDGIYRKTGSFKELGRNNIERDIVSWNGDLQQACKYISIFNPVLNQTDNMDFIFQHPEYYSPKEDILADIDAMNITKMYIDFDENTIANSLAAYYRLVSMNSTNRYEMFVNTVIIDTELRKTGDLLVDFQNEIYCQFNVKNSNGILENKEYYESLTSPVLGIMRNENGVFANTFGDLPSFEIRSYVTTCFVNYVVSNCRECYLIK